MPRFRCTIVGSAILLSTSLLLHAQQPDRSYTAENVFTAPEQLRRMAPPDTTLSAHALEAKGDQLRGEKAYADSLDYYRAAFTKQPAAVLHNKIGITHLQMLRYDEAKRDFEHAIQMDRTYADAYNNLGVIHYINKNYRRAMKYYSTAIKLRDDSASFHSNMGTAYFARKQIEKASQQYARALELDPEIFERHSNAGVSAHMTSLEDRAHYAYVIAKMFAVRGDTERCLQYLRKAMEEGYPVVANVNKDREFQPLQKDPRFAALLSSKPVNLPQ